MKEEHKHENHTEYLQYVKAEHSKRAKLYADLLKDDPLAHIRFIPISSFEEWLMKKTET